MSSAAPGRDEARKVSADVITRMMERFTGFPVPDAPFDPSKACADLLRKYGLPPRPDPVRQPLLRRTWDRGFGRPMELLSFKFNRDLVDGTKYRLFSRHADEMPVAETRFESSSNWSGAYITANRDRQFLQMWGVWKIPGNLQLPPAPLQGPVGTPYVCSNWIGLDGQRRYLDLSLPQIGTASTLEADGTTTVEAWTQWWARHQVTDTPPLPIGLPVKPDQEVLCVLTALNPQTVIFVMVNLSTQPPTATAVHATSPRVTLPGGKAVSPNIAGATAEWIVERPRVFGKLTGYNFPDYGRTKFGLCVAVEGDDVDISSWLDGLPQQLDGARRIRMFEVLANPARTTFISMPRELDETSVHVKYGSF